MISVLLEIVSIIYGVILVLVETLVYKFRGQRTIQDEENIDGKVVVVTGANRGIGKAATYEFAKRGATVVMGCVDLKEGAETMEEIKRQTGNNNIFMIFLDLSDMDVVETFASSVNNQFPEIKILFNNAGLGGAPMGNLKTKDGFNIHMAVNHLGHFLLTNLLIKNLQNGGPSRVVSMSSTLQLINRLDIEDLMMDKSGLGPGNILPYANTKFANGLFTYEFGKKFEGTGVTSYALCPGLVRTSIFDSAPFFSRIIAKIGLYFFGFDVEEATEGILYCALSKSVANETGKMYRFKKHLTEAQQKYTPELAHKLWDLSSQLVRLDEREV